MISSLACCLEMTELRAKYLDPSVLQALGKMQVKVRALAQGVLAGMHRSPHRGGSVEFAEYIEYSPGHEIRHIDWRVYGKSDKYYVKQFQDETNAQNYFVLDGSGSMNFRGEEAPLTKLDHARFVAATLAYLIVRQGDAVGAVDAGHASLKYLPAASRTSHLDDLFLVFEQMTGSGQANLLKGLKTLAERARPRSRIVILSDMLDADRESLTFLRVLRRRRFDVIVFHPIDPAELSLPYEGLTQFVGLEGDGDLLADPDDLRQAYQEAIMAHLAAVQRACEESDIPYIRFLTTEPIEEVVLRSLRGGR